MATPAQKYLARYPDVANHHYYGTRPQLHYHNHGRGEGRIWEDSGVPPVDAARDYLNRYPDVAADPYWGKHPLEHYNKLGQFEGRTWEGDTGTQPPPPPPPPPGDLPRNNIYYIDDACLSKDSDKGGDPNGFQDNVNVIAMATAIGSLPYRFGVSSVRGQLGISNTISQLKASGYDIPVLAGSPTIPGRASELSRALVEDSKRRDIKAVFGGPVTDLAQALKDGALVHNLRAWATCGNTSNYKRDPEAAKYCRAKLGARFIEIDEDYKIHLGEENLHDFMQPYASKVPMVRDIWSEERSWILKTNASYNYQRVGVANVWTISDCLNYLRASGQPWKDYDSVKGLLKRGLNKMSK